MAIEAKDVAIIGGGFAGLSAGVALAERGFRVALLESKPALGGRAYSFPDPDSEDFVDNGQHVLMGCYRATLEFLERIGTRDRHRGPAQSGDRDARGAGPPRDGADPAACPDRCTWPEQSWVIAT